MKIPEANRQHTFAARASSSTTLPKQGKANGKGTIEGNCEQIDMYGNGKVAWNQIILKGIVQMDLAL